MDGNEDLVDFIDRLVESALEDEMEQEWKVLF